MLLKPEITDAGICATTCPHRPAIRIGSMSCELCDYYFGVEGGCVRCAGARLEREAVAC